MASGGFPSDFWWGTGNSSNQCEGAATASTWWDWERNGHAPRSGDGNGFAARFRDDFEAVGAIGLDHFRLSLEWARLEPVPGRYDRAEIERYRSVLQAGVDAGFKMWVCAHHFTLPTWFADKGGFGDARARSYYWRRHITFLAETFGDLVFGWKPINEPHAFAMIGWLLGTHPPGNRDLREAVRMLAATHLANHEAWMELRGADQPVATIHDLSPALSVTAGDEVASQAAESMNALAFSIWTDMITDGVLHLPDMPGLPHIEPVHNPDFVDAFDVVGFSYYSATGVRVDRNANGGHRLELVPYPGDAPVGPMGYAVWSEGLEVVLEQLWERLGPKPLLISEYGIGTDDDAQRARYIQDGVTISAAAIERGIDLKGFFHWTGVDNYEWEHGYSVRFGLFDRDRNMRPSAQVLARVAGAVDDTNSG